MAASNDRDAFYARCLRVTSVATAAGVTMRKSEGRGKPTLLVSGNGKTVEFPIVTDDRAWRETSVEEAFYVVLLDAREWSGAHVDEASIATLVDDVERAELPIIRKDLGEEIARVAVLADILGGRAKLEELWSTVELASA
ncbi:MAG: hypothetical protein NVS1B2_13130 [Vulcanimicrobiaceae bacterium]